MFPPTSPRHCEPPVRANARPGVRSNPAKRMQAGLLPPSLSELRRTRSSQGLLAMTVKKVLPKRERHSLLPACHTSTFAFHGNRKTRNKAAMAAFDPTLATMSNAKLLIDAHDQRFFVLSLLSVSSHPL